MRVLSFTMFWIFIVMKVGIAQNIEELWETAPVFDVPESILLEDTIMYVSNIVGETAAKDGNGFISILSTSGNIISKQWATGLNAPKGMCMNDQFLFVTDIDEVVIFDRKTGEKVSSIKVKGAKFLNDIIVTEEQHLYITDFKDKAIYRFNGEKVELFVKEEVLDHANGLHYTEGVLYVGSNSQISMVNLETREIKKWGAVDANVDGIVKLSGTQFLVSSWSGKVQLITQGKAPIVLINYESDRHQTADFDYDAKTNTMYIPTFFRNTVMAVKLMLE